MADGLVRLQNFGFENIKWEGVRALPGKSWSEEKIVKIIRQLRKEKKPLSSWRIQRFSSPLYQAACVYFGNWPGAIAAGLDYEKIRAKHKCPKWSRMIIAKTIQDLHSAGQKLNSNHVQVHNQRLYGAAVKYFGGWKEAVEAAGLNYDSLRVKFLRKWNEDEILRAVMSRKCRGLSLNGSVVAKEDRGLYQAARRHFGKGGWKIALRENGIDPKAIHPRIWTKKKVLSKIKRLSSQGIPLHGSYLARNDYVSLLSGGRKVFGSWRKAIEAAGLKYEAVRAAKNRWWNKKRIIYRILSLERHGQPLNSNYVHLNHGDLFSAAVNQFGSWGAAVEAAGIDYRKHSQTWSHTKWLRDWPL